MNNLVKHGVLSALRKNYVTNHILRHTFATRMCESDINIKVIQDILGHSEIQTTLDIYTDATEHMKKKNMKKLSDYLER